VLFSRKDLAEYINRTFEPAWETVLPVPLVHVDFGNGKVLTRTLQGNIATYVCTPDGYVVDVLPCIYDPVGYWKGLEQLSLLATVNGKQPSSPRFATLLENYHLTSLLQPVASPRPVESPGSSNSNEQIAASERVPPLDSAEDLANWKALRQDTRLNETVRRRQIHALLADKGLIRPGEIMKFIYKEVLHTDLDDPYMGLGSVLFANYPFVKEDK
jgi:hypothetical protein